MLKHLEGTPLPLMRLLVMHSLHLYSGMTAVGGAAAGLRTFQFRSDINTGFTPKLQWTLLLLNRFVSDDRVRIALSWNSDESDYWLIGNSLTDVPSDCLLYTSPSPRDRTRSRMPSSA